MSINIGESLKSKINLKNMNPNFEYISCAELNELLEDPGKRLMLIDCQKPNLKNPKERIEKTIKFSHHLVPEEYGFPEPSKHHERKIKLLDEMLATESEQFFVFYSLSEDYYLEKIILDTIRYLLNVVFRKENIKYKILEGKNLKFKNRYEIQNQLLVLRRLGIVFKTISQID